MPLYKIKPQIHVITVTASGQEIPIDLETDKLYNTITGINVLLSDNNAMFSTIPLEVNGTELFPENFEVARIKFKDQSPLAYDYLPLNLPAGGSRIKGKYTDKGGATYPYTVSISFRLEIIEDNKVKE